MGKITTSQNSDETRYPMRLGLLKECIRERVNKAADEFLTIRLRNRTMTLRRIDKIPIPVRGKAAEFLVAYELLKYGDVYKPPKGEPYVGDWVVKPFETGIEVPIEAKQITIENPTRSIDMGYNFLEEFSGIYIVLKQRPENPYEHDFVIATKEEMKTKVKPHKHDKAHTRPRWRAIIHDDFTGREGDTVGWKDCIGRWDKVTGFKPEAT
jgi:hypothetical protein